MYNNKITIVTVTYNCKDTIDETIHSVLNQSYENVEYIVVDGSSNDGTLDIIKKYERKLSNLIIEKDDGIFDAMNKSLKYVSGDYVLFMNSGDKFYNNNVIRDIFYEKDHHENLIFGDCYVQNDLGYLLNKADPIYMHSFSKRDLVFNGQGFSHQSLFTKTSLLKTIKFDLRFPLGADYYTTYQIYQINKESLFYVGFPISIFDDRLPGASHNKKFMPNIFSERVEMFNYHLKKTDYIFLFFKRIKGNSKYQIKKMFPYISNIIRLYKRDYE